MSDVVDETRLRAANSRRPSRRARPRRGRLLAAFALAALSGLMLLHWLTYSVPRCEAAPAFIQTIPPTRVGEPETTPTAAPQAAHASDDCSGGSLFDFVLPSPSRTTASFVSNVQSEASDVRARQQSDDARQPGARPSPSPSKDTDEDRPNIFRRFFRWLFKPFFRNRTQSGSLPPARPVVRAVTLSDTKVSLCKERYQPTVRVAVSADPGSRGALTYEFEADEGSVTHEVPNETHAVWDLSSAKAGPHTLKVVAREQRPDGHTIESKPYAVEVEVESFLNCRSGGGDPCASFSIKGPPVSPVNRSLKLTADLGVGVPDALEYSWKVSHGSISEGQGRRSVTVDTAGLGNGQVINAEVSARLPRHTCNASAQVQLAIPRDGLPPSLNGKLVWAGEGVAGATVHAVRDGRVVRSVKTSSDGTFALGGISFGEYLLVAEGEVNGEKVVCKRSVIFSPETMSVVLVAEDVTGNATPTPTPAASGTPTPEPTPSPSPDASPSPTPGETPSPTPTPTPTPIESPTPAGQKRRVEDKISVSRPGRFLEGQEDTVTCELAMVFGEVIASETFQNGVATVIDKPSTPKGGQAGPLSESFGEDYTSSAQFRLVSDDLDFRLDSPAVKPVPARVGDKADWTWRVRLKDGSKKTVSFTVRLDVVWRPKTGSGPDIVRSVWERKFENVPVGLPLDVKASKYGSLIGGIGALGVFAVPGLRRKRLDELQAEMDRLQSGETGHEAVVLPAPAEGVAASAESPPGEVEADEVSCSVYTRREASPGDSFLVQVFAHLSEQAEQLAALASEADEEAASRGSEILDAPVARGSRLTVKLDMPPLEVDEPVQTFVWKGQVKHLQFGVTVPEGCAPKSLFGKVTVCLNTVPIGHIRFAFKIVAGAEAPRTLAAAVEPAPTEQPAGEFVRYRQAFISYCSQDRAEVLRRVQMLRLVKLKFRQDLLDLEPGQKWESALYQYIDESDVFFLFWSNAAKESEWVEKELKYALSRKGGRDEAPPEIVPVIIEGPPPAKPPSYLAADHFNDTLQYFVWVEDQLKKSACGPQAPEQPPDQPDDPGAARS